MLFVIVSTALGEFSDSVGKKEVRDRVASLATFGFLNLLFGTLFLIILGYLRHNFVFSLTSLPTFIPRAFLEILQAHLTVLAVVKADRSDFGLIKSFTIPLLLIVDISLGYSISSIQIAGIIIIFLGVLFLLSKEHFRTKGFWLLMGGAINAVITISLFKYDISHFNSVESEQIFIMLLLMIYFFILAVWMYKENPLKFLRKPIFLAQSGAAGLASAIASYAYLFAPAAIITAALRAFSILSSLISGKLYFHEKNITAKIISFCLILLGLFLLI